ncbi:uncharacterized protein si:ch211-217g15.3 isoform X2 [Antennarius striatus]|uniref:uncharacterized protein si:ch211-217g15.3 isoform X2 n=1 Tax=Antennarius striatus TaxID=241820 RepID=UPI0035ADC56D
MFRSKGLRGQMLSRVEVEPPEDEQEIDYNISPDMKIWNMKRQDEQAQKAGEELVHLKYHSVSNLLKVKIQSPGNFPVAEIQTDPSQDANMKYNQQPEEDRDDIDHPVFTGVNEPEQDMEEVYRKGMEELQRYLTPLRADKAAAAVHLPHSVPEEDEDDLYHGDDQPSPVQESVGVKANGENTVRVHLQPEEDMDDLYHRDVPMPILYQGDPEPVGSADVPSERMHSEPEEDLDHLYHH